jgi:hypothetical protein
MPEPAPSTIIVRCAQGLCQRTATADGLVTQSGVGVPCCAGNVEATTEVEPVNSGFAGRAVGSADVRGCWFVRASVVIAGLASAVVPPDSYHEAIIGALQSPRRSVPLSNMGRGPADRHRRPRITPGRRDRARRRGCPGIAEAASVFVSPDTAPLSVVTHLKRNCPNQNRPAIVIRKEAPRIGLGG